MKEIAVTKREDVTFRSGGVALKGWLFRPDTKEKVPAIVMAHGWAAVKEMYLAEYAEYFASQGFAVLVYDHKNFGESGGDVRQEIDPNEQIEGYRDAMTFLESLDFIDSEKIGLWGTSYSGGHVLVLATLDPRVKCVVSQCPTISGGRNTKLRYTGEKLNALEERFRKDRRDRQNGYKPEMVPFIPDLDINSSPALSVDNDVLVGNEAGPWFKNMARQRLAHWRNETTLKSLEMYQAYEPGSYVSKNEHSPVMMVLGKNDRFTPTEDAVAAYDSIRVAKELLMVEGGHFDLYGPRRGEIAPKMKDWFAKYLF